MKKRLYLAGFGIAATLLSLLPLSETPAIAKLINAGTILAENVLPKPKVNLQLVADQQVVQKNAQGKETVTWKALGSKVTVKPGDMIRFTVTAKNEGDRGAKGLAITQPITRGMVYVLNSATPIKGATLAYSIDQGKTFVTRPVVKVTLANGKVEERPAPAEAYTHVRWNFSQSLEPNTSAQAAYLVKVR